jgi:MFS family permease
MNLYNARMNLIFCSILHGLNHYGMIFFKPMYPSMSSYYSLGSISEITTRMTILYTGYGIANFLTGLFARKVSLRLILFFGNILMCASALCVAFVPTDKYPITVALVFLMGLGGGTYHPAANTLITSSFEGKPGHAIGLLSVGSAFGFVLAPFIGEYVGENLLGFRTLFMITGITGLVFSFLFLCFVKDHPPVHEPKQIPVKNDRGLFALSIFIICIPVTIREIAVWGFYEVSPFWVKSGFSHGVTVSMVQSMQYIPGLLIQPLTGKLCDRFGARNMVMITVSMTGLGLILFSIPDSIGLWFAMVLFGAGVSSSTVAGETFMAKLATKHHRALVYGIVLSVGLAIGGYCAGFSGTAIDFFGRTVPTGFNLWFISIGLAMIISTTAYIYVERIIKKRSAGMNWVD